jgi:hypothetical protein
MTIIVSTTSSPSTCLDIVSSICLRVGFDAPSSAVGTTNRQIAQIVEVCNESGQELARRYPWQALLSVGSFDTVATETQGAVSTIAPGLDYIINDTIWNRDLRRPVFGPKTPQAWEQQKAFAINGPWSNYRIIGDSLSMYPVPTAGQSCYFEYISKYWVSSTGLDADNWQSDSDTPKLDKNLLILDTIWRWKSAKGLDYAEDFNKAERLFNDLAGRDGGKDTINLANNKYDIYPGIVVPAGSWSV